MSRIEAMLSLQKSVNMFSFVGEGNLLKNCEIWLVLVKKLHRHNYYELTSLKFLVLWTRTDVSILLP